MLYIHIQKAKIILQALKLQAFVGFINRRLARGAVFVENLIDLINIFIRGIIAQFFAERATVCRAEVELTVRKRARARIAAGYRAMLAVNTGIIFSCGAVPVFKGIASFGYYYFNIRHISAKPVSRHKAAYTAADNRNIVFKVRHDPLILLISLHRKSGCVFRLENTAFTAYLFYTISPHLSSYFMLSSFATFSTCFKILLSAEEFILPISMPSMLY